MPFGAWLRGPLGDVFDDTLDARSARQRGFLEPSGVERVRDRFGFLPYGGQHTTVIPHLTIATRLADDELDRIEADIERWLPIECSVDACEVWEHAADGWRMMHPIPLGPSLGLASR